MKRFAALALAAALAAGLAGCGGSGTLKSMDWAIEPAYEFEAVEPVADTGLMTPWTVSTRAGEAGYYLAKTAGGWAVLNALTGDTAAAGAFLNRPTGCGDGHLYDPESPSWQWEDPAKYDQFNAELEAIGTSYRLEVGHGGSSVIFLADEAGTITATASSDMGTDHPELSSLKDLPGLVPVRQGRAVPTDDGWDEIIFERDGLWAVASSDGRLLTDFVYEYACMATDEAVAVCKEGKWGYVDAEGKEIVPCEYEAFWGKKQQKNEAAGEFEWVEGVWPAPFTEGCVVVKQNGQTGVLNADGSWLLKMGEVEDAAPAFGGLLWVKTEGKWGALKLPA